MTDMGLCISLSGNAKITGVLGWLRRLRVVWRSA